MGYALSWAAVRDGNPQTVWAALGLRSTGKREAVAESKIVGVQLPTGWYLVLFDRRDVEDRVLARLSLSGEVVSCFVEDHVMVSWASGWRRGKKIWSVIHGCEKGHFHLETKGEPPDELKGIAERLIAEQRADGGEKADVDHLYDVPAELAKQLTGFRHDQDAQGWSRDPFEILQQPTIRRWGYVWLFFSTPIVVLLYLLSVTLFGTRLPVWATAAPGSLVMLALVLHVVISCLVFAVRNRRKEARLVQAAHSSPTSGKT